MNPSGKPLQPIIIKRIKKSGKGHLNGAWKIAYADFVTAMMAFFLLMWLLGSTNKGDLTAQRKTSAPPMMRWISPKPKRRQRNPLGHGKKPSDWCS